uniref:ribonucleoside-diphosphate reductase n=1 Tax=Metapenaeus ensis nimavirus TaxID=2133794 RepID=A0A401IPB4_9VIRU|nr:MAG: wsv188-like protein [Metapenaeus ensis nimavirus]GBG35458.1 wsv188-like protein [Metapenaeus ensis nimavirus]
MASKETQSLSPTKKGEETDILSPEDYVPSITGLAKTYTGIVLDHLKSQTKPLKALFSGLVEKLHGGVKTDSHPLLIGDDNRFVTRPIRHQDLWEMYQRATAAFWTVWEVDLKDDVKHWKTLHPDERKFISHVLAFFAVADGVVIENLILRIIQQVKIMEAKAFYCAQINMEFIHADMYGKLIDTIIPDEEEKNALLHATENFPSIRRKIEWACKWIEKGEFSENILAFAVMEGIFFSGAFAAIFWLKEKKVMPGLTYSNELISRDEALHRNFACMLFTKGYVALPSRETVLDIITEAVEIEKDFFTDALPNTLIGLNVDQMKAHIEYVADNLLEELNMEKHYGTKTPLSFMESISMEMKTNFFERRVAEYQRAGVMASQEEGKNDFEFWDDVS